MNWTSLPSRARSEWALCCGSVSGRGRRETTRMIHLDRRAFSAPKLRINGMYVYPWTSILSVYLGDLSRHIKLFYGTIWSPSRSRILSAADMRDFSWIRSKALPEARRGSRRISGSFPRPTKHKYNSRDLLWFKTKERKAKGLATSKRLSIIVARVPNLNHLS